MPEYRFTLTLANGLHARPASLFVEVVTPFAAQILVVKGIGGAFDRAKAIDARSVLSLVGLDVKKGDECVVVAEGADAEAAIAAIREFVENRLALADEPPAIKTAGEPTDTRGLPMCLRRAGVRFATGRPVCGGIGTGLAVLVGGLTLPPDLLAAPAGKPDQELRAATAAATRIQQDLAARAKSAQSETERELLAAHAAIALDPALWAIVRAGIETGSNALAALAAAVEQFSEQLRNAQSAYIRDRALDVQDVGAQILQALSGGKAGPCVVALHRDSVIFADALTPNQLLKLDRRFLKGLVLGKIGATSHTIILARTMRIPTLIEVEHPLDVARAGDTVIVDASPHAGYVLAHVSFVVARYYERERKARERWLARVLPTVRGRAATQDGHALEVAVNATTPDEIAAGIEHGADGVGLLRTELLFLERKDAPSEEEQFEAYAAAVRATAPAPGDPMLPVIIRTFDIGGDKPAPYLPIPKEENPFLGVRGLRLYESHAALLRTQLRAILRASAIGPVKIMAPMVATPAEAKWFRLQVHAVMSELAAEGKPFDKNVPIGIMIEVPAAAMLMDQLAAHVDFFSVGTNDLTQYLLAADRGNQGVAALCNARQPALLRTLRRIVQGAKASDRWIGLCGEMGGDPLNLPLMVGLGLDEVSMGPGSVLAAKRGVNAADAALCRAILDEACNCTTPQEVEQLLRTRPWRAAAAAPVLDASMIGVSDALTKEEAIKDAVDLLYVGGRTEDPREVEDAVWAREATYSTGLGFGFAVPHCKSKTVTAPTLAILRLETPVDWGSMDGQPVKVVLLLAIPADDTTGAHMKVFAKLARKLMHEEFRERLLGEQDPSGVQTFLREELGLTD